MVALTEIPFCGQTYSDKTLNANAQEAVNLYPMRSPTAANPNRIVMYPTPGYDFIMGGSVGVLGGDIRGGISINDIIYFITGSYFCIFPLSTVPAILGTLLTHSGRCSVVTNTVDITISDGQFGYVYNLTTGAFTQIGYTGGWPIAGVTNLTFQDGYYIGAVNNSRTVIHSALLDGTTWPALAFDTLTSFPDNISAVFSDQIILYAFGPKITEPQADVGSIPYAFQKVASVLIQAGCAAKETIVKVGTTLMFLANDLAGSPYVAELIGYNAKPISTPPINEVLARYSTVSDAHAYTYREGDNQFYVITFPSANSGLGATWAYDVKMQQWHKRWVNNGNAIGIGRDYPDFCFSRLGEHIIGGKTPTPINGNFKFYRLSQNFSVEIDGVTPLRRLRTCQHVEATGNTLFFNELMIDIEPGVGLLTPSSPYTITLGNNPIQTSYGFLTANPITTVSGSNVITITDPGTAPYYNPGDPITLSNATAFNGLALSDLNRSFIINSVPDSTHITVISPTAATASGSGGGNNVNIADSVVFVTSTNHGLTTGTSILISGATAVGGIPAVNLNQQFYILNVSANIFAVLTGAVATSSAIGGGAGVTYQLINTSPLATLEMSRDSGHTWTTVGSQGMGRAGSYKTRLIFRNLGRVRKTATFRLTITDAVRTYILGAFARIKLGTK